MICRATTLGSALLVLVAQMTPVYAQSKYSPGASDSEIKIGTTTPFSGPSSAYSNLAVSINAYFSMINAQGGINGRKINFISLDDAYSPPKTVEQTRRLVESEEVLLIMSAVGTAPNAAVVKYVNSRKVPDLFVGSGATLFNDPTRFPYTVSWSPHYASEGEIYAKYLLSTKPDAKIAILSQNDDLGKDYVSGFRKGLGDKENSMIVAASTYNTSDPTIDSQIVTLKASGADVLFLATTPKFTAQALRKVFDLGWHPLKLVDSVGSSIAAAMKPAGPQASKDAISAAYQKDPADPQWKDDLSMKSWVAWMDKYNPGVDKSDYLGILGFNEAYAMSQILKSCGNNLTREEVIKQATNLDMELPLLLPGIRLKTSPDDHRPIKQMQLVRFSEERWTLFGEVMSID